MLVKISYSDTLLVRLNSEPARFPNNLMVGNLGVIGPHEQKRRDSL